MNIYNILALILLLVIIFLLRIRRHLTKAINEKYPENREPDWIVDTFQPWYFHLNKIIGIISATLLVLLLLGGYGFWYSFKIGNQQGYQPDQPIKFSHQLHAGKYKMDCRYCHSIAEKSKNASIPSPGTCMNCHRYVQATAKYNGNISPEIKKIYEATGWDPDSQKYLYQPKDIKWVRIHNLPDLAYFNHSQHVKVGKVQCQTCHGQIQTMQVVQQFSTLQMGWCIDCHRTTNINVEGNKYYEDLHKRLKKGETWTEEQNGGTECGKCHY